MFTQLLTTFINIVSPVFGMVIIGYLSGPRLHFDSRTLSRFAYYILMPAIIFDLISQAEFEIGLAATMAVYIVLVQLGCALLGLVIAKLLGCSADLIGAFVLIAVFPNAGNFGLSMIEFKLGQAGLAAGALYLLAINMIAFPVGVIAANWAGEGKMAAILAVIKTPAVLAFLPAAFFWITQSELPLPVARLSSLLADATIPVMAVTLGVQLTEIGMPKIDWNVFLASAVRLVGGPLLSILLAIPFGLFGLERSAGILQASMPPAVLTIIIAMEHDLVPEFVTTALLFGTLASLLSLTVVLSLV